MESIKFPTVDAYLNTLNAAQRAKADDMRLILKKAVPEAEEVISYNMPAYKYGKVLYYFMVHTKHVGFYPTNTGIEAFREELAAYKTSKGAIQFSLDQPLPAELITEICRYRFLEEQSKVKKKPKG
ncbi:MAG: hypothetical protein HC905_19180 [Bacteroidales bacterium]|nr:hypothetical protein [Bacteroidales bacterium]